MTSDTDDLEQQLRENLKLRRELAAEVAKAKDSSASQRVSRGVNRLSLLLGAIALVVGTTVAITFAKEGANGAAGEHQKLLCAHNVIQQTKKRIVDPAKPSADIMLDLKLLYSADDAKLSLRQLNCSTLPSD